MTDEDRSDHKNLGLQSSGEKDLAKLLASMSPELASGDYVFCTFPGARYGDHADLEPVVAVSEDEGLTLILTRSQADEHGLNYGSVFRRITLKVHSSLDAVGLTAAFSGKLAEHGLSANVVAGFFHDHIYIQRESATRAMEALTQLTR